MDKLEISDAIYAEMKKQRVSMKKVADRAGIGPAQVNRVMYGKGYTIDTLLAILGELDMIIKVEKRS